MIGLYRSGITDSEHLRKVTVGRDHLLADIREKLQHSMTRKSKQHSLFIGPRGSGKTHLLSLVVQEIHDDKKLASHYVVARFPEESLRLLSYVDLLLGVCEILKDTLPPEQAAVWGQRYDQLVEEPKEETIRDTLEAEIKRSIRGQGKTLLILLENFDEVLTKQMRQKQDAASLRKLLMGDNGCMLIATAPIYFSAVSDVNQPFYDFFDVQSIANLSEDETVQMIRLNLEWDQECHKEVLKNFDALRPRIYALFQITDGNPRLTMMLYELIAHDSVLSARDQFLRLLDRITPFYQDRIKDIPPQERAILETMAKMRGIAKTPIAIAARMRMGQQQTSMLLKRLTTANYVKSISNPSDKRSRLYVIREGFFDLWLAMNLSRAESVRLPFLIDFFEVWFRSLNEREERRRSLYEMLKQDEKRDEAATALDYLSEVGSEDEKAAAKVKLAKALSQSGVKEKPARYVAELRGLHLEGLGGWIADRAGGWQTETPDFYADLEQMIECWKTQRTGNLEAFVKHLHAIGDTLTYKTYSEAKVQFLEESLKLVTNVSERIKLQLDLASLFHDQARWIKAEKQLMDALADAEKTTDYNLASVLNNLCLLYIDMSRYAEAEPLIRHALTISEKVLGCDHPNVATELNNLALLLINTHRYAEAEPLMRRALEIDEKKLGVEHPSVATDLNNLAHLLSATNRFDEAERLLRRALKIDESTPVVDLSRVSTRLNNFAQLLGETHRFREAAPLIKRALEIDEKLFGVNHPNVARDLNNFAQLLANLHQFEEAERLQRRALTICSRFWQTNRQTLPKTTIAMDNYISVFRKTGFNDIQLQERFKEILGDDADGFLRAVAESAQKQNAERPTPNVEV
jgi:tetratricopeptide (TPR) repeat protein/energy-coupling factor transporter ATP-binding protein EcfA2